MTGARCHCRMQSAATPSSIKELKVRTQPIEDAVEYSSDGVAFRFVMS